MLISPQNSRVKLVRQLQHQRDARESEGLFVAEGVRLADDFIGSGMQPEFALVTASDVGADWQRAHANVQSVAVSDSIMRDLSMETTPPGVLVVFRMPRSSVDMGALEPSGLVLILDQLRDPGNLGACLRVAAGADCRTVLLAPGSVDPFNPKVVRGAMGAHARLQIASLSWVAIDDVCRAHSVWAAEASGTLRYDEVPWCHGPSAIIVGGEATGVSAEARRLATGSVTVPLANNVESLNAAVACGVLLFEAARQRRNCRNA